MLEVTESARKEIREYFDGKNIQPIRVFLAEGGCSGPYFALALDEEAGEADETYDFDGLKFLVDRQLMEHASPLKLDSTEENGFVISSGLKIDELRKGAGGGCGGGCAGCGSAG